MDAKPLYSDGMDLLGSLRLWTRAGSLTRCPTCRSLPWSPTHLLACPQHRREVIMRHRARRPAGR